jgi:protoheme ferro-lyase
VRFLPFAVALLAGTLAGAVTCAAFVVRRSRLAIAGVVATATAAVLIAATAAVWSQSGRADTSIASMFIALGALAGGYALAAELLPAVTRPRQSRPVLGNVASGDSVGVILLADAESDGYRASDVTRDMDTLERGDVPLPPHIARPFVYASERARYRTGGGSPARSAVGSVADALAQRLRSDGIADSVVVAFCTGDASVSEAAARLAGSSGRHLVIAALTVAWTPAFDAAAAEVHALDPTRSQVVVETTEPLWASHALAVRAAERALAAFGDSGIVDGVVLVTRGNPWQVDRRFPAAMEQATYLSQRIRAELIEAGLPAERVRQAWMEWEEPDVREAVRHLAALGASHVALVPVDLLFSTLAASVDLPMAAERARMESDVRVAVVEPLNDDPVVIAALRRAVTETVRRFLPDGEHSLAD